MLEKKHIKYTKNGIEERNIATGEANLRKSSSFNQQSRFYTPEVSRHSGADRHRGQLHYSANYTDVSKKSEDAPAQGKDIRSTLYENTSIQAIGESVSNVKSTINIGKNVTRMGKTIYHFKKNPKVTVDSSGITIMNKHTKYADIAKRGGKRLASFIGNEASNLISKSDETSLQVISTTMKTARTAYRGVKTVRRVIPKARTAYRITSRVVHHVSAAMSSVVKKLLLKPIIAGGASASGAIIPIVLIFLIICVIFGGSQSDNASDDMLSYIKQLDANFIALVLEKQEELGGIQIFGLERVNTDPDNILALLSVTNDYDTELSSNTKQLLSQFHSELNTFSVETYKTTTTDEKGNEIVEERTIIAVETYTVQQKVLAFNLDEEQSEMLLMIFEFQSEVNTGVGGTGKLSFPLKSYIRLSSPYGQRIDPITNEVTEFHTGADISAHKGTPIYPAADGIVTYASMRGTYGNLVIIQHDDGTETYYAHCDAINTSVGTSVNLTTQIATVGETGRVTGPHLHFEYRINGRHTDPMEYF